MNKEALIAWTSLYIAVGIMALICAVLAVGVTADDWRTKRWRPSLATHSDQEQAREAAAVVIRMLKVSDGQHAGDG